MDIVVFWIVPALLVLFSMLFAVEWISKKQKFWAVAAIVFLVLAIASPFVVDLFLDHSHGLEAELGYWSYDEVWLMYDEASGEYGCFGCNNDNPPLCLDPLANMKSAVENSKMHCDKHFEVIEA